MRLVEDDRAPAPSLDDDALPAGWGAWIAAEAAARGCPRDYVAAGLIAAASAWCGNARHVAATATWTEPPHLWLALIGLPSTGKTPALRPMIEASRAIERDAEPAWQADAAEHATLAVGAGAIEKQWRAAVAKATKEGEPLPKRPPGADAPPAPPRPRVLVMDSTTEELQHLLSEQHRGLLYMRDELAGWLGNHDRYGGHGGDRAFFLEAWNGAAYVADRVKYRGQPVRIACAALAILGGMQPDRLREALADPDDGLAARLVYVWPDPVPILPLASEPDAAARVRRDRLTMGARRLYGLAMDGDPGEPAPRILRLDREGLALYDELRQDAMQRARSARGLAGGWHGKTPGRALRLALVYDMLRWAASDGAEPREVSADAVARAGGYLDYLVAMLDRVTARLAIGRAEADAAVIARHILATRAAALNERAVYQQPGWAWLREAERRAAALNGLVEAGWIRAGGAGRQWTAARRLGGVATAPGEGAVNRWRQRLAELHGDGAQPPVALPRAVQDVRMFRMFRMFKTPHPARVLNILNNLNKAQNRPHPRCRLPIRCRRSGARPRQSEPESSSMTGASRGSGPRVSPASIPIVRPPTCCRGGGSVLLMTWAGFSTATLPRLPRPSAGGRSTCLAAIGRGLSRGLISKACAGCSTAIGSTRSRRTLR